MQCHDCCMACNYLLMHMTEHVTVLVRRTNARVGEAEADGLQHRAVIHICRHICHGL